MKHAHRPIRPAPLFDPGPDPPPRPKNDTAPIAVRAGVKDQNIHHNHTPPLDPVRPGPRARHDAPSTSHAAAASMVTAAAKQGMAVLEALTTAGTNGVTDRELEALTGFRASTITPRRGELVELGLVVDSGRRRPTPSGRLAIVWILADLTPSITPPETPGTLAGGDTQ